MDSNFKMKNSDYLESEDTEMESTEVLLGDLSENDQAEEVLDNLSDRDLGGSHSMENLRMAYLSHSDVTGGDVDDNWYQAEVVGEEAVGGGNPTPDQNVTVDILQSVGIDDEEGDEIQVHDQLVERDRVRWELEPESAEDH
jgi:hypothetical protein